MTHARTQAARRVTVGMAVLMATALGGCATHAPRVDCGGRLEPINAPAPVADPASANSAAAPPSVNRFDHASNEPDAQKDRQP